MREETTDRAVILGEYILDTGATVRATAKVFKISKSTVHTAVTIWNGLLGLQHKFKKSQKKPNQHGIMPC